MTVAEVRLARLRDTMEQAQVDLVAIGPTANMHYLLGFAPVADERLCLLLVTPRTAQIVVPALNADKLAENTDLPLIRWTDEDGPGDALAATLRTVPRCERLAIDGTMRADFLLPLIKQAGAAQVTTADVLLAKLRQCKSQDEVEALALAAAQADRAMLATMDACRLGASESEIAWVTEAFFRQDGAQRVDFALIASGPNGAFPHHQAGARRLQPGDSVILDIGASLNGYKSDITRTVHMGPPSEEFLRAYAAVQAANAAGRAAVRPGATAQDVDLATRDVLERAGLGQYFVHRTGHGIGLEVHEAPWITSSNPQRLESGMVFSVEPGLYFQGKFGIRIEDIVAVTEDGVRNLTGSSHALVIKD